ncbi:MAG TPA: glycine betaine ABC transporter substrate-binding protein [Mycobacteriales bacterium]|nr:glycine betaine ABC transporter substrate-binding protein [Mycobacteriales bacterium]
MRSGLLVVLAVLLLAGCTGDDQPAAKPEPKVTVGAGLSAEQQIIARMYGQALSKAGFDVTMKLDAGARTAYVPALERGDLDVVPDYLAPVTDYLRAGVPVAHRPPAASGDVEHTAHMLDELLAHQPLGVTRPSLATDQTALAVSKTLADDENLVDVSDLRRLNGTLVLGAPDGCSTDALCLLGLQDLYGLRFKRVDELGEVSGQPIFDALRKGTADVGSVQSSDGEIAAESLVVLRDDKLLEPAGNIIALYRAQLPASARAVVDSVNRALTTEKLQELNKRQDLDGQDPDGLAKRFLQDARLI